MGLLRVVSDVCQHDFDSGCAQASQRFHPMIGGAFHDVHSRDLRLLSIGDRSLNPGRIQGAGSSPPEEDKSVELSGITTVAPASTRLCVNRIRL